MREVSGVWRFDIAAGTEKAGEASVMTGPSVGCCCYYFGGGYKMADMLADKCRYVYGADRVRCCGGRCGGGGCEAGIGVRWRTYQGGGDEDGVLRGDEMSEKRRWWWC